jgi:hypothetical protein
MYTLMRGLAAAFGLGFAYVVGWSLGYYKTHCVRSAAIGVIVVGLFTVTIIGFLPLFFQFETKVTFRIEKITAVGLMMALMGTGYVLGEFLVDTPREIGLLSLVALSLLALALRCFGSYKSFAREFAKAVWRDFIGHDLYPEKK